MSPFFLATRYKTCVGIYNHVSRKCNIEFSEPVVLTLVSLHGPLQMSGEGEKDCREHTYPHAVEGYHTLYCTLYHAITGLSHYYHVTIT